MNDMDNVEYFVANFITEWNCDYKNTDYVDPLFEVIDTAPDQVKFQYASLYDVEHFLDTFESSKKCLMDWRHIISNYKDGVFTMNNIIKCLDRWTDRGLKAGKIAFDGKHYSVPNTAYMHFINLYLPNYLNLNKKYLNMHSSNSDA